MGNGSARRSGARGTPRCRPRSGAGQSEARARSGAERDRSRRCCRCVPEAVLVPLPQGSDGGERGFGWKKDKGGAARRRNSLRICREPSVRPFSGAVFPLLLGSRGEGAGSGAAGLRSGVAEGCGGLRGAAGGCGAGGSRAAALLAGPGGRGCHRAGGGRLGLAGAAGTSPRNAAILSPLFSPRGGRTAMETRLSPPGVCAGRPLTAVGC